MNIPIFLFDKEVAESFPGRDFPSHDVVLTSIQRCLDVNNVVTTLKQRCALNGFTAEIIPEKKMSYSLSFYNRMGNYTKGLLEKAIQGLQVKSNYQE